MLVVAWRNRSEATAPWFAATVVALLIWTVGYIFELMAVGLQAKLAWADAEFVGLLALPLLWLQLVLLYSGRRVLSWRWWTALGGLAVALLVGLIVNPHRLFRIAPTVVSHGSLRALDPDYGPLSHCVGMPFVYGLLAVAFYLLVRTMLHAHRLHVRQSLALLVATALPLAAGTLYVVGLSPWPNYNPAMAVLGLSGLLMAYALFSCRIFDLAPLARDAVMDQLSDGLLVLDAQGRLRDYNPAAAAAFTGLRTSRLGSPASDLFGGHPELVAVLSQARSALQEHDEAPVERAWEVEVAEPVAAAGSAPAEARVFNVRVSPFASGSGRPLGLAVVARDVTARAGLLDEAVRLATTDALTGVLARGRLVELAEIELGRAARHGAPLSLLLLDVDRLKAVNDNCGHLAGDHLLCAVAAACQAQLREGDCMGRMGGDEFCVLLPSADREKGCHVAERLQSAVRDCAGDVAGKWQATVSIGVATTHRPAEETFDHLLEAADRALYAAKNGGRDRVAVA